MDDRGLQRCLRDNLTPKQWYQILNARVFFWLTKERLDKLLSAGSYEDKERDVLQLETRKLVGDYEGQITLSPMNSGCTKPIPHPRGLDTFLPIATYPYAYWRRRRRRGERVVELAVSPGVINIEKYVIRVVRMKAGRELQSLYVVLTEQASKLA